MLVASCLVLAAAAQNGKPTMTETIDFLIGKTEWIREIGLSKFDYNSRTWTLKNPQRCELIWTTPERNARYDRRSVVKGRPKVISTSPTSVFVNLADFDPSKVGVDVSTSTERRVGTHSLYLETTDEKKTVTWSGADQSFKTNSLTLHFDDDETATRYANAIKHAITLCGGKGSQKKEPF